jgi:arabinofuranosyltransferase
VSIAMSLVAVWIYARHIAGGASMAAVGLLLLVLSKSFVDYSTSGLENPLTHLLVAAFFAGALTGGEDDPRRLLALSAIAGLLAIDRLDAVVLVAPLLALRAFRAGWRRSAAALTFGAMPFLAWELFSLVYYGLLFPNTAYAKLGGEVLRSERVTQGMLYIIDAFSMDPLTPAVIGMAIVVLIVLRDRQGLAVAAGLLMSMSYVMSVGGDFMSGRMLTSTFFISVFMLTRYRGAFEPRLLAVPVTIAIMLGVGATDPSFLTGKDFHHDQTDRDGIVDERRVYFAYTGLMNVLSTGNPLTHPWADAGRRVVTEGRRVVVSGANGFFGFVVGRHAHVVDRFALGDAFLARLPAEPGWYTGHLARRLPDGYAQSVATGRNAIVEPGVHALYERMRLITQAPLFTPHRLHAIWRLNTDGFRDLLEGTSYDEQHISAQDLDVPPAAPAEGAPIHVHERGVVVEFGRHLKDTSLEITTDGNDDFFVVFRAGRETVGRRVVHRMWYGEPTLPHAERVAPPFPSVAFDRVLILPRRTWEPMGLWSVRVL